MNLTAASQSLIFDTASANAVRWEASWTSVDQTAATTILPGSAHGVVSSITSTTAVSAPAASIYRTLTSMSVYAEGGSNTVLVKKDVGGTGYALTKAALAVDESLHYEQKQGWYVLDASGAKKGVGATGAAGTDGGGTILSHGTTEIDFGSGSPMATVDVTGQAALLADSLVYCWIHPVATDDHTAEEHMVESIKVMAIDIVAGDRFTIWGFCPDPAIAPDRPIPALLTRFSGAGTTPGGGQRARNAENTLNRVNLLKGKWTVGWFYTQ